MQINRLFEIIYILLDKKKITAKELAKKFEVSPRTIYRDIETLSAAGIPVYMSKGKGGGISLLPDYVLNKAVLTSEEKEMILSSLNAINAINLEEKDIAIKKLSCLFGGTNPDWIEVEFTSWGNDQNEKELFNSLKGAVLNKKVILFIYSSVKGEKTTRKVEPFKLCFKNGAWYLYGYCILRSECRFFKLRRIKKLVLTDDSFKRVMPIESFKNKYSIKEKTVQLKLKLSASVAYRVYEECDAYEELEDGSFIGKINYPNNQWLYYYIATFGSQCEVLEPIEIRNAVKKHLQKTLRCYD